MRKSIVLLLMLILLLSLSPIRIFGQEDVDCEVDYVVQTDDSLSKIAKNFYGDLQAFPVIVEATNKKASVDSSYATIENVDTIELGWKLCLVETEVAQAMLGRPLETVSSSSPGASAETGANAPSALLDATTIPKYVEPLAIPPVMESMGSKDWEGAGQEAVEYWIAVRQFEQQILPSGFPKTTVWGYGRYGDPLPGEGAASSFNYPAFTIETRTNEPVRVVWVNQLVDNPDSDSPQFLPHLLPVDPTLHWANPAGQPGEHGLGSEPYQGPIPIVTHVHGAHVASISDGYPDAWYLPAAANIPDGYATQGFHYRSVHPAPPGAAVFEYTNDQPATTLWYHDHALGITRLNVYAGMAGFWLIRDEVEDALNLPGPAPKLGDPPDKRYYEIPIVFQDRSFNQDGSLFYPDNRAFFDEYTGPYRPETPVSPIWNPEFFGDTIAVNGKTWPYLEVEPRLYRLRLLNGSNSRFYVLKFMPELPFYQIGSDGGLLPGAPVVHNQLVMAPAERADVLVDFSAFQAGDEITLLNFGPDSPFGGLPVDLAEIANPDTTGQVMQFRLVEPTGQGNAGTIPETLPMIEPLSTSLPARDVTLNETMYMPADVLVEAELGTGADGPLSWDEAVTENPIVGDTEIWRIINLTADAHPIHLHLVQFKVLDRIPFDKEAYMKAQQQYLTGGKQGDPPDPLTFATGDPIPRALGETGRKDTVIADPDHITRLISHFDLPGLYVWHCHILEHEDNEMMRPYIVRPMPQ